MSDIHDAFHISVLRKWMSDVSRRVPEEEVEVRPDLSYREEPERILAFDVRKLRNKQISMVRVQWKHSSERESTWEKEADMRQLHPGLFDS